MAIKLARHLVPPVSFLVAAAFVAGVSGRTQESDDAIETGKTVTFEYTISEQGGGVLDSNIGAEPVEYVHGQDQILPRLEEALAGVNVGDEVSVTLPPEDAYGPTDPAAYREVPVEQVPEAARAVGARLAVLGIAWPVLVKEVRPEIIVLDLNHPFAGKTLTFVVRVLSVR